MLRAICENGGFNSERIQWCKYKYLTLTQVMRLQLIFYIMFDLYSPNILKSIFIPTFFLSLIEGNH